MFRIVLISILFMVGVPAVAETEFPVTCEMINGVALCSDEDGNIFAINQNGEVFLISQKEKKKHWLEKFGNALEEGFSNPNHRENKRTTCFVNRIIRDQFYISCR